MEGVRTSLPPPAAKVSLGRITLRVLVVLEAVGCWCCCSARLGVGDGVTNEAELECGIAIIADTTICLLRPFFSLFSSGFQECCALKRVPRQPGSFVCRSNKNGWVQVGGGAVAFN